MLVQISKAGASLMLGLTCLMGPTLVSCATHKETALVNDPTDNGGSSIPWNKQEKWEQGAEMGGLANSDRAR